MISFVGAGPGDLELITAKGVRLLQQADVVIYDRLVNPLLLHHCQATCRFLYVGKTPYQDSMTQQAINELLQAQAPTALVVRLKGGDPAIFGRLSEEIVAVKEKELSYEVVPGVTAASGVATYAGISLTEREVAPGVLFLTGHAAKSALREYPRLDPRQTICLYMGIQALPLFLEHLITQDFSNQTPVMVTSWGTTGFATSVIGTIDSIATDIKRAKIKNPAMIVIGQVILNEVTRNWFQELPHFGQTVKLVSTKKPNIADLVAYSAKGYAIWWQQVGPMRDRRFDAVAENYFLDHEFHEVRFLDAAAKVYDQLI